MYLRMISFQISPCLQHSAHSEWCTRLLNQRTSGNNMITNMTVGIVMRDFELVNDIIDVCGEWMARLENIKFDERKMCES